MAQNRASGVTMARVSTLTFLALCLAGVSSPAAELTDVIDAADGLDPFDFVGTVQYRRSLRRAKITREYNCDPRQRPEDAQTCSSAPSEGRLMFVKELRFERVVHEIVPEFRFGLWHDLELRVEMPIVVSSREKLRFAGDGGDPDSVPVTPENSTIAPGKLNGKDPENLFEVPFRAPDRAGFGDMLFQLRFAPLSRERSKARGEWVLDFGWRAPTGETMKGNNSAVGRGLHEIIVGTAFSYRSSVMDPYLRLEGIFSLPASDTLFKDYGGSQNYVHPGALVNLDFGTEIIPVDHRNGTKFYIDLGLGASYQGKGRDYSEVFDALASAAKTCNPNGHNGENCAVYNTNSDSKIAGTATDGITTVDEYMKFRGHFGLGVYILNHTKLGLNAALAYETAHFMSTASIGKDLDNSGLAESKGSELYNPKEHNPTYVPAIDNVGRRLRIEEVTVFTVGVNLSVLF